MVLRYLNSGDEVLALTQRLVRLGVLDRPSDVFGRAVVDAVKRFQARHCDPRGEPLVIDGQVGPMTAWAIGVAVGEIAAPAPVPGPDLALPATGGSKIGRAALAVALAERAAKAGEEGSDNAGSFVRKYQHDSEDLAGAPWCASFVSWCFEEAAGDTSPFGRQAAARGIWQTLVDADDVFAANAANPPQPGDLIVWWREPIGSGNGHVGIVHSYADGVVRTIEGNRGSYPSMVASYTYVLGRIEKLLGFGRVHDPA